MATLNIYTDGCVFESLWTIDTRRWKQIPLIREDYQTAAPSTTTLYLGLIAFDMNKNVISIDEASASIFNVDVNDIMGVSLHNLIPALPHMMQEEFREQMLVDVLCSKKSGPAKEIVLVNCHLTNLQIEGIGRYFLVIRRFLGDVNADDTMHRFSQMAEDINEIFWIANSTGSLPIYVSPAYERIYGRTVESLFLEPKQFFTATHPDDRKKLADVIRSQRKSYGPCELEFRIFNKIWEQRWLWARLNPLKDSIGN